MLAHPQLHVPRYTPDYSAHHVDLDRTRASYYPDVSSLSPGRSDSPTAPKSSPTSPHLNTPAFEIVTGQSLYTNASAYTWPSVSNARTSGFIINSPGPVGLKEPDTVGHYSDSPSPIDIQPSSAALPLQDRFPHLLEPLYTALDRTTDTERCSRIEQTNKYSHIFDHRRSSQPTSYQSDITANSGQQQQQPLAMDMNFSYTEPETQVSRSSSHTYPSPNSFHRGAGSGALRKARHHPYGYASHGEQEWKDETSHGPGLFDPSSDKSLSPMHSSFAGAMVTPSSSLPYSPVSENFYGQSPPGTGTSTSSVALGVDTTGAPSNQYRRVNPERGRSERSNSEVDHRSKNYSFIALPGNAVKKRPRRRFDEIERLYRCKFEGCTKAYGTLNHLNAHVTMQKHGDKRSPLEFRDLRKQWKAAKKEAESQMAMNSLRRRSFAGHEYDYDRFAFSHPPQRTLSLQASALDLQSTLGLDHDLGHSVSQLRIDPVGDNPSRYGEHLQIPPWNDNSTSRALSGGFDVPSATQHLPFHLPQMNVADAPRLYSVPEPPSPPRTIHHLPANSTLLTPLVVSYQSQSFVPVSHDALTYAGDNYDFYDDSSRPGTGTTSLGPSSGDELLDDRGF